jgi:GTP cyclohydrolase II
MSTTSVTPEHTGVERPDPDEVFRIAEALVPTLAARAADAEQQRKLPDETVKDLEASGLLSVCNPRSAGGWGYGIRELGNVSRILAQGCASTAWVYHFFVIHQLQLLTMNEEGQQELLGGRKVSLAASTAGFHAAGSGTAIPVDGGWRLTGKWPFASGIMNSDWVYVVTWEPQAEGDPRIIGLVLKVDEVDVEDMWHFSGLKATGSNTLSCEDLFVPARREWLPPITPPVEGAPPRTQEEIADCPLDKVSQLRLSDIMLPSVSLGAAEAALALFKQKMHKRIIAFGGGPQIDHREAWSRFAEAFAYVRLARLMWDSNVDLLTEVIQSGGPAPLETAAILRLGGPRISRLARDAVLTIMDGAGSSVHHLSDPLQRIQRDIDVVKSHNYQHWDGASTQAGHALLGLDEPSWLLTF